MRGEVSPDEGDSCRAEGKIHSTMNETEEKPEATAHEIARNIPEYTHSEVDTQPVEEAEAATYREETHPAEGEEQSQAEWFAVRTSREFRAEEELAPLCEEVLLPKETVMTPTKRVRTKALIPRVLFIKTDRENALRLERAGREHPESSPSFWIYRYPKDNRIQVISEASIRFLKLLSTDEGEGCEIFTKTDFKEGQHVRVIGGPFQGLEGSVQRVKKNRHVVVKIEGVCMIMLPYIHPDLLKPIV